jgi:hypothetical protein
MNLPERPQWKPGDVVQYELGEGRHMLATVTMRSNRADNRAVYYTIRPFDDTRTYRSRNVSERSIKAPEVLLGW